MPSSPPVPYAPPPPPPPPPPAPPPPPGPQEVRISSELIHRSPSPVCIGYKVTGMLVAFIATPLTSGGLCHAYPG